MLQEDDPKLFSQLELQNTELLRAKKQLQTTADEWSRTFDSTTDLISIIGNDYRLIRVNRAMAEAIGRSPEDCVGLNCYTAIHGRVTPHDFCPHKRTLNTLQSEKAEFYEPHLGMHLQVATTPFFSTDGILAGSVHVAHDITTHVQDCKIITEKKEQLKVLNETLEARIASATCELTEANLKLRTLSHRMEKVRENERKELAREVHDEIGQMLVAIKFELSRLCKDNNQSLEAIEIIATIDEEISFVTNKVQQIISKLRPAALDFLSLCDAIKWVAEEFTSRTSIPCEVKLCTLPPLLTKEQETSLFRIAQEALSNISRHAAAQLVTIGSERREQCYTYFVADNGRGISDQELLAPDSFGIMGMYERAEQIGATAEVSALQDKGTIVRVHIPL